MKRMFVIFLVLLNSQCFSQIIDYFIPNSRNIIYRFEFETQIWENENGAFNEKKILNYFSDPSGNFKIYSETITFRHNVPQLNIKSHNFYSIVNNTVTFIYSEVEGLTEGLRRQGIDNAVRNTVILKYPPSQWQDKSDKDVTVFYESAFGSITTDYATYDDCIIVTKKSKSNSSRFKWAEKYIEKFYYARELGLVKTERYENGKLLTNNNGTSQLVDNFSRYSNFQKKQVIEEKKRINEFLIQRKSTVYSYQELDLDYYNILRNEVYQGINSIVSAHQKSVDVNLSIRFSIDTLNVTSFSTQLNNIDDNYLKQTIENYLSTVKLKPLKINNYVVNAYAQFQININQIQERYSVKYTQNRLKLARGASLNYSSAEQKILGDLKKNKYPSGHYDLSYIYLGSNDRRTEKINYENYKSFAGPSSAFASVLVPGLGNRFVSGGEKSGIGRTILVYSLIGSGIYSKKMSNDFYTKYHSANNQNDIDANYDKANDYNKASYFLIGSGVLVWLYDIYSVVNKGAENKRNQQFMNRNLKLSVTSDLNRIKTIGLTYNF